MEVQDLLVARGGVATRADVLAVVSRAEVDQALRRGDLVAVARGRYAVPAVEDAVRAAHALGGILSRESAALHHGWAVKTVPTEPHVSVPRNRKLAADRIKGVQIHRDDLHPDDVEGVATSKEVTLTQCLRARVSSGQAGGTRSPGPGCEPVRVRPPCSSRPTCTTCSCASSTS